MCRKRMMGRNGKLQVKTVAHCDTNYIIHTFTLRVQKICLRLLKQPHLVLALGFNTKENINATFPLSLPLQYILQDLYYLVLMDCGSVPTPIIGKLHYFSLIFNEALPPLFCWLQIVKRNLGQGYREKNNKNK